MRRAQEPFLFLFSPILQPCEVNSPYEYSSLSFDAFFRVLDGRLEILDDKVLDRDMMRAARSKLVLEKQPFRVFYHNGQLNGADKKTLNRQTILRAN